MCIFSKTAKFLGSAMDRDLFDDLYMKTALVPIG